METALDAVVKYAIEPMMEAYIISQVPALGLPVLKQMMEALLDALVQREAQILKTFLAFTIIDGQVNSENKAVKDQLVAWNAAHATGDPHAIQQASDDLAAAFGRLIHYDGS